jgi:uncharacterized protein (DUF3820 family)
MTGKITRVQATQLTNLGDYRLAFGKNIGKTLDQIWDEDYTYLAWFLRQDKTDCKQQQMRVKKYIELKMLVSKQRINLEEIKNGRSSVENKTESSEESSKCVQKQQRQAKRTKQRVVKSRGRSQEGKKRAKSKGKGSRK